MDALSAEMVTCLLGNVASNIYIPVGIWRLMVISLLYIPYYDDVVSKKFFNLIWISINLTNLTYLKRFYSSVVIKKMYSLSSCFTDMLELPR